MNKIQKIQTILILSLIIFLPVSAFAGGLVLDVDFLKDVLDENWEEMYDPSTDAHTAEINQMLIDWAVEWIFPMLTTPTYHVGHIEPYVETDPDRQYVFEMGKSEIICNADNTWNFNMTGNWNDDILSITQEFPESYTPGGPFGCMALPWSGKVIIEMKYVSHLDKGCMAHLFTEAVDEYSISCDQILYGGWITKVSTWYGPHQITDYAYSSVIYLDD